MMTRMRHKSRAKVDLFGGYFSLRMLAGISFLLLATVASSYGKSGSKGPRIVKDPIELLIKRLSDLQDGGLWKNGLSPNLNLPATTTINQIVENYFGSVGYDSGKVTRHRILKSQRAHIQNEDYQVIYVETDLGNMILVVRYMRTGWWAKEFAPYQPIGRYSLAKEYSETDPIAQSWGDQRDYFKKNGFAVIEWKDAEVILTNQNLKGGKQYHTGWLTIITADGPKYLTKQPKMDAYCDLEKSIGLKFENFGTE
jgi:hypothetical protein